jgi:hypothetical protein
MVKRNARNVRIQKYFISFLICILTFRSDKNALEVLILCTTMLWTLPSISLGSTTKLGNIEVKCEALRRGQISAEREHTKKAL